MGGVKGCNVHCNTAYGKMALLNTPWAIGTCVEGNCFCAFNEKQIKGSIPKNCVKFYFSSLEDKIEIVEEVAEEKFSKLSVDKKFESYMKVYEKSYSTSKEKRKRLKIFEENLLKIGALMAKRKGSVVYGIGPFTDLSREEFVEKYIGKQRPPRDLSDEDDESGQLQTRMLGKGKGKGKGKGEGEGEGEGKGEGKGKWTKSKSPPRRKTTSGSRSRARSLSPPRSSPRSFLQRTASGHRRFRPAKEWDPEYLPVANGMSRRRHNLRMNPDPDPDADAFSEEGVPMIFGSSPIGDPIEDWRIPAQLYPPVEHQDQGDKKCGSCWAFAALGAVEMHWAIEMDRVIMLSKQDLVDCVPEAKGCESGDIGNALLHVKTFGVSRAEDYPYVAETQDCNSGIPGYMTIGGYDRIRGDRAVAAALKWTPVPAGVHLTEELQFYVSGVFESEGCSNSYRHMNHAVTIVGHYEDAWIVRNSWGPEFGLQGHYLLKKGTCAAGKYCMTVKGPFKVLE